MFCSPSHDTKTQEHSIADTVRQKGVFLHRTHNSFFGISLPQVAVMARSLEGFKRDTFMGDKSAFRRRLLKTNGGKELYHLFMGFSNRTDWLLMSSKDAELEGP